MAPALQECVSRYEAEWPLAVMCRPFGYGLIVTVALDLIPLIEALSVGLVGTPAEASVSLDPSDDDYAIYAVFNLAQLAARPRISGHASTAACR